MKLSELLDALGIKPTDDADKVDLDLPVTVEVDDDTEMPITGASFYYDSAHPRVVLEVEE